MTSRSFYLKKPEKTIFQQRKHYSQKGKFLSQRNPQDLIPPNLPTNNRHAVNSFQSIFDFPSSLVLKQTPKTDRRCFKSVSSLKKGKNIVNFVQKVNNPNKGPQSNVTSAYLYSMQELRQKNSKIKRHRRLHSDSGLQTHLSGYLNQQTCQQQRKINQKKECRRTALQSTNISITSLSCLNKLEGEQLNRRGSAFGKFFSKNTQKQIRNEILQSLNFKMSKESPKIQNIGSISRTNLEQTEIQIRLSLKSLSKSQKGENNFEKSSVTPQISPQIQNQKKQLTGIDKSGVRIQKVFKGKPIYTSRSYKSNRMLIRFDKKLLFNANQINNSSLKIQKINIMTSRIKTQPQA